MWYGVRQGGVSFTYKVPEPIRPGVNWKIVEQLGWSGREMGAKTEPISTNFMCSVCLQRVSCTCKVSEFYSHTQYISSEILPRRRTVQRSGIAQKVELKHCVFGAFVRDM